MTLTTGQLLAQRYRLGRRIAVGGMGEVWEAEDIRLERQVAVKVLRPELSGDPEFRQRFHTEARLTASLNHPGIAAVHDYGEATTALPSSTGTPAAETSSAGGTAFLVMELVAGDPLARILMRQSRLSPDRTLDILGQAADALQAAHERGLVHRDIKPGNILITPAGRVKLTDFGIAKAANTAPVTRQGIVMGTAHYIAPEQAAGAEAGPASDVYSLAVVGYECLAGRRPFQSGNTVAVAMMHIRDRPPPLPPDVPSGIRGLIEAALVKDPRRRYRTGGEFAAAIAAVRDGHPPPLPAALTGFATTAVPTSQHQPRTALLPPGSWSDPPSGAGYGPLTGRYHDSYPPQHDSGRRGTIGVAVALLAVLGLVLAAYGIREALRPADPAGAVGRTAPATPPPATPAPATQPTPVAPEPTEQDYTDEESTPTDQPTPDEEESTAVFVVMTDYLWRSGAVAAATATDKGLEPLVVDPKGDEIDPEDRSECRITRVDPPAGWLAPGSLLELTCRKD